ncbi:LytR/AlgR family response regulator transcription factor [Pararhodonellum marinum]|uniref:LytR/AlgR family response regulator transcription factor n=1 Tax=Pararhodonellum marinum TaxID=2755358 RepID=UPI001890B294|nr:LytTR family DNA-binding domain-containing protein [Pararhodonellum marinum]
MTYEKGFINCMVVHKPEEGYKLSHLLQQVCAYVKTLRVMPNWENAWQYLNSGQNIDLIVGSFELTDLHPGIFDKLDKRVPVVFTSNKPFVTEKAFSLNCLDFVNESPHPDRLKATFEKYFTLYGQKAPKLNGENGVIKDNYNGHGQQKSRFLVKLGDELLYKTPQEAAFFMAEEGLTYLIEMGSGNRYLIDYKLMDLEEQFVDQKQFFRVNRSILLNIHAIDLIKKYLNSRLQIVPKVDFDEEIVVSREKVKDFKKWINQ